MKIYKDIIQRSEEWFFIKKGKMSASHAQAIANQGKGLESYVYEIVADLFSKESDENYTNPDMDRGNSLEDEARILYSVETDKEIDEVGFVELNEYVGCSPDGLIGKTGGLEIKCPNNIRYLKLLIQGEKAIDSAYIWQIQMNLLITSRKWWDFVAYNPNYKTNIIIIRIKPDLEKFKKLEEGFEIGTDIIKELSNKIK